MKLDKVGHHLNDPSHYFYFGIIEKYCLKLTRTIVLTLPLITFSRELTNHLKFETIQLHEFCMAAHWCIEISEHAYH